MKWIKYIWAFLVAFIGMCLIGFFGLTGIFGACGFFISLLEHCPGIFLGLGMFIFGVLGTVIGWGMFRDWVSKLSKC